MIFKSKRPLILLPTTGFGGAELHTIDIVKQLKEKGMKPTVGFPFSEGTSRLYRECIDNGFDVVDMPIDQLLMATAKENIVEQSMRFRARLVADDYDIVIVAAPSPTTVIGLLNVLADVQLPGICIFHLVADTVKLTRDAQLTMLRCLRTNFKFVCVSEFSRDMLCKALGLSPDDGFIDYIENGIEIDYKLTGFEFGRYVDNANSPTVVTVGRIHQQKGGRFLVESIPYVLEKLPNTRFLWFGEGPQKDELWQIAGSLGVQHALMFPGYTEQPANAMKFADAVVLPTLYEGLSLTLLEAMHSGAALVTTDASYQDRILTSGVDALVARRADSLDIAQKTLRILSNPDLRKELRINIKKLSRHYTRDRMLEEYISLLSDITLSKVDSPEIDEIKEKDDVCWIIFVEGKNGKYDIALAEAFPNRNKIKGKFLTEANFLRPAADFFVERRRIGIAIMTSQSVEELVKPKHVMSVDAISTSSFGAAFLDALRSLGENRVSWAFQFLKIAVDLVVKLSSKGKNVRPIIREIFEFSEAFDATPFSLAGMLLKQINQKEVRTDIIDILSRMAAASAGTNLNHVEAQFWGTIDTLQLSKLEKCLYKRNFYFYTNQELEYEKYDTIYNALCNKVNSNKGRKQKVIFFADYFNYPPLNGSDKRMLSLLEAYQHLGFDVHFCGVVEKSNEKDKAELARKLRSDLGIESHFFNISEEASSRNSAAYRELASGNDWAISQFGNNLLLGQLRQLVYALEPDVFHVNYCYFAWAALATLGTSCHRVLDTHDVISRRACINRELKKLNIDRLDLSQIPFDVHKPDWFAALRFNIHPLEELQLRQFDTVLTISADETSILKNAIGGNSVRELQLYFPCAPMPKAFEDENCVRALYAAGKNSFNKLGGAAIQNHILPYLSSCLREDQSFEMRVVGDICDIMLEQPHSKLEGRIKNIDSAYLGVDFALCPIPAGTGQNVKLVEALSHGIPVITYNHVGRAANVEHGINGLLANDVLGVREFALQLINDPAKRKKLSETTKRWAVEKYTRSGFAKDLREALVSTGFQFL